MEVHNVEDKSPKSKDDSNILGNIWGKIRDPRKRVEQLLVLITVAIAYFYLYVYQSILHVDIRLIDLRNLIRIPMVALVIIPAIYLVFVKADPLQRSPSKRKPIRFFQNEFPSNYILLRCEKCIENENSCPNYINAESYAHRRYWFRNIFHGPIEDEDPRIVKDTFEKGYTCKLVYYLSWILIMFFALTIITILVHHIILWVTDSLILDLKALQLFFPIICISIVILLKIMHRANEYHPTGCWQAWREINRFHVSWLKSNEDLLANLICKSGGGSKQFIEKSS